MPSRRTYLRGIASGVAALSLGGIGSAVADDDTDDQGDGRTAEVRVGHLSPDTPGVDVYVMPPGTDPTDDIDPVVEELTYGNFAPGSGGTYLDVPAGTYDVSVTPAGAPSTEAIDVDGFELGTNSDNTVLAVGELSPEGDEPAIGALPLVDNGDDDTALPPADATLLRAVHASPDAGAVDIALDGTVVLEGVEFGDASPYLEIQPGDRTLSVRKGGATALDVDLSFAAGTKVSGYVVGNAVPESGDGTAGAGQGLGNLGALTTLDATSPTRNRGRGNRGSSRRGNRGERGRGRGRGNR